MSGYVSPYPALDAQREADLTMCRRYLARQRSRLRAAFRRGTVAACVSADVGVRVATELVAIALLRTAW